MRRFLREMRALVWKEWRQHRVKVMILLWALFALTWAQVGYLWAKETAWMDGLAVILALLIGAEVFAPEYTEQTVVFLSLLPVRRARWWVAKVGVAALIVWVYLMLITAMAARVRYLLGTVPLWRFSDALTVVVLVFGCAVFASAIVDRGIAAVLVGGLVASLIGYAFEFLLPQPGHLSSIVSYLPPYRWWLCAPGVGFLLASFFAAVARRYRVVHGIAAAALLVPMSAVLLLSALFVGDWLVPPEFDEAKSDPAVSPDGSKIALLVSPRHRNRNRLAIVNTDGSGHWLGPNGQTWFSTGTPSCGRPPWSDDGSAIVYVTPFSFLGFWRDYPHASWAGLLDVESRRAKRLESDRVCNAGFVPGSRTFFVWDHKGVRLYSQEGAVLRALSAEGGIPVAGPFYAQPTRLFWIFSRVCVERGEYPVVSTATLEERTIQIPPGARLCQLSPGGRYIVYLEPETEKKPVTWRVQLRDETTKRERTLAPHLTRQTPPSSGAKRTPYSGKGPNVWECFFSDDERRLAFTASWGEPASGHLVDLSNNTQTQIGREEDGGAVSFWCSASPFSPDGKYVRYGLCPRQQANPRRSSTELHVRELDTGRDMLIGASSHSLYMEGLWSKDSTRLALGSALCRNGAILIYDVRTGKGAVVDLPGRELPVTPCAWLDDQSILICQRPPTQKGRHERGGPEYWVIQADGTGLRRIFP